MRTSSEAALTTCATTCVVALLILLAPVAARAADPGPPSEPPSQQAPEAAAIEQSPHRLPDPSFFDKAAFVSIDFQPPVWRDEPLPKGFAEIGISRADVDAARRYLVEVALPNARRVADGSRELGIPLIFVHWGYQFSDAMDLEPSTYNAFLDNYGPDTSTWPHHISDPTSKPADELGVRPGEYVIAKTAQDAFASSNIAYVLENLQVENIVFVGGDTGACLGGSARSAIAAGYKVLCVKDATFDASERRRLENFERIGCHYIVSADEFEQLVERAR
jgi:nicotinamidase-related amidase